MFTDFFAADDIEATARRTGFVQRTSKLTGKLFLALMTFGAWSEAKMTLAQLAAQATQLDLREGKCDKTPLSLTLLVTKGCRFL